MNRPKKKSVFRQTLIVDLVAHDVRFPTSRGLDDSDAMKPELDDLAVYVVLKSDFPTAWMGTDGLSRLDVATTCACRRSRRCGIRWSATRSKSSRPKWDASRGM